MNAALPWRLAAAEADRDRHAAARALAVEEISRLQAEVVSLLARIEELEGRPEAPPRRRGLASLIAPESPVTDLAARRA